MYETWKEVCKFRPHNLGEDT